MCISERTPLRHAYTSFRRSILVDVVSEVLCESSSGSGAYSRHVLSPLLWPTFVFISCAFLVDDLISRRLLAIINTDVLGVLESWEMFPISIGIASTLCASGCCM